MRDEWGRKIPKKKSAVQIVADAFHGEKKEKKPCEFCNELKPIEGNEHLLKCVKCGKVYEAPPPSSRF